jgi:hypothetical protein
VPSHEEKLRFAVSSKDSFYRANKNMFERIQCGHNPWLYGRRVTDLRVVYDELVWTEPEKEEDIRRRLRDAGMLR